MGLSRNKVAVSEGAAGSPPFYGERGHCQRKVEESPYSEIGPAERAGDKRFRVEHLQRDASTEAFVVQLSVTNREKRLLRKKAHEKWGCSSAGRAPALQAGGQGFDSLHLHQPTVSAAKARRRFTEVLYILPDGKRTENGRKSEGEVGRTIKPKSENNGL